MNLVFNPITHLNESSYKKNGTNMIQNKNYNVYIVVN